ncbi:MAG: DUF5123 domain-containing protein [Anaerolineales bacterium]|nr:DUF5123 domain-containing protein [Anaerolineales bacterium]
MSFKIGLSTPIIPESPGVEVPGYKEFGLLEYADALLEVAPDSDIHILVSRDPVNIFYNSPSLFNFITRYYLAGGNQAYWDVVRYYTPGGITSSPPGLHAKSFLIDNEFLVIGSQNFDHSAFGNNSDDLDLAEYSIGIEDGSIVSSVNSYLNSAWNNSGKLWVINKTESPMDILPLVGIGDVVFFEPGTYKISSTLNIHESITLVGSGATILPEENFSNQSALKLASPSLQTSSAPLLRITGDNVSLIGLTLQDSSGYAIEVEGGVENVNISRIIFENNALGGVYVSDNTSYTIENNTFVGDDYGITISTNANSTGVIRNNIFAGQNIAPIHIASANDGTVEYAYNLFYDCNGGDCSPSNWKIGNLGANSNEHDNLFDLNPLFANPANGDYRLSSGSPAIDAGDSNHIA